MYQYVPIIRPDDFSWEAVGQLSQRGGLFHYSSDESGDDPLVPLIEVLGSDDLNSPERYSNRFERIFVDSPLYHEENEFSNGAVTTANFHNEHTNPGDIPVLSQESFDPAEPMDYSPLQEATDELSENFSTYAIRIMVQDIELTPGQNQQLQSIESAADPEFALLDIMDIGSGIGQAYENIQQVLTIFDDAECFVLNAFDPHNREEFSHNYGPVFSRHMETVGFGDYMLERRQMPGGNPQTQNRVIRYYIPSEFRRFRAIGERYAGAADDLLDTAYVSAHCDYCRQFLRRVNHNRTSAKTFQIGHYVLCMRDHLIEMDRYSAEDLDMDGYNDLAKQLGFDTNGNQEGTVE